MSEDALEAALKVGETTLANSTPANQAHGRLLNRTLPAIKKWVVEEKERGMSEDAIGVALIEFVAFVMQWITLNPDPALHEAQILAASAAATHEAVQFARYRGELE